MAGVRHAGRGEELGWDEKREGRTASMTYVRERICNHYNYRWRNETLHCASVSVVLDNY